MDELLARSTRRGCRAALDILAVSVGLQTRTLAVRE